MTTSATRLLAIERLKRVLVRTKQILQSNGFKIRKFVYWRETDEVIHAIAVRRSPWTESSRIDFFLDCGVSVQAWRRLFPDWKWSPAPADPLTQIYVRLREISAGQLDDGGEINNIDDEKRLEELSTKLAAAVERYLLPFFNRFQTAKQVADYLSAPESGPGKVRRGYREIPQDAGDLRHAAIAYTGAGEYARAFEMLELAETTIDRHGKGHTADLRKRIERYIARQSASG